MPRPLTPELIDALDDLTTSPLVLVMLGFNTPLYLSSRSNVSWDGETWLATDLTLRFKGLMPTISVFNEGTTLGQVVLSDGTAGRDMSVYLAYPDAVDAYSDPQIVFKGIMGRAEVGEQVIITSRENLPVMTPRQYVLPPTFNHTPKAGERITTPEGVIILEA